MVMLVWCINMQLGIIPNCELYTNIPWNALFIRVWRLFSPLKTIRHNTNYTELAWTNCPGTADLYSYIPTGKVGKGAGGGGSGICTFQFKRAFSDVRYSSLTLNINRVILNTKRYTDLRLFPRRKIAESAVSGENLSHNIFMFNLVKW